METNGRGDTKEYECKEDVMKLKDIKGLLPEHDKDEYVLEEIGEFELEIDVGKVKERLLDWEGNMQGSKNLTHKEMVEFITDLAQAIAEEYPIKVKR